MKMMPAGSLSLTTTSHKKKMLLCVLKLLHLNVVTKTGHVKKNGWDVWLKIILINFLVTLKVMICAGLMLS